MCVCVRGVVCVCGVYTWSVCVVCVCGVQCVYVMYVCAVVWGGVYMYVFVVDMYVFGMCVCVCGMYNWAPHLMRVLKCC